MSPSNDVIHVFGCLCYVANRSRMKDKFDYDLVVDYFLGICLIRKGLQKQRLYDLETSEFCE